MRAAFDSAVRLLVQKLLVRKRALDNLKPSLYCPAKIEGKILVQPHGGLGTLSAELRLRLRDTEHETFDSNNLLATSNVVVVGYGGGDDPVVEALIGNPSLDKESA